MHRNIMYFWVLKRYLVSVFLYQPQFSHNINKTWISNIKSSTVLLCDKTTIFVYDNIFCFSFPFSLWNFLYRLFLRCDGFCLYEVTNRNHLSYSYSTVAGTVSPSPFCTDGTGPLLFTQYGQILAAFSFVLIVPLKLESNISFSWASDKWGNFAHKYFKHSPSLGKAIRNCFIKLNSMSSGGRKIFFGSTKVSCTMFSPGVNVHFTCHGFLDQCWCLLWCPSHIRNIETLLICFVNKGSKKQLLNFHIASNCELDTSFSIKSS